MVVHPVTLTLSGSISMAIYLYIKQCDHCGLKYFGRTIKSDPYKYEGSGVKWKRHLKKHKSQQTTLELFQFENQQDATEFALDFSIKNNIVESKDWANMIPETALSSDTTYAGKIQKKKNLEKYGVEHNFQIPDIIQKMIQPRKETNLLKYGATTWFATDAGRKSSSERMKKIRFSETAIVCPHCQYESRDICNIKKYHFDNCKNNPDYTQTPYKCKHCQKEMTNRANFLKYHDSRCKHQ